MDREYIESKLKVNEAEQASDTVRLARLAEKALAKADLEDQRARERKEKAAAYRETAERHKTALLQKKEKREAENERLRQMLAKLPQEAVG